MALPFINSLERPHPRSLPSSLFQREESLLRIQWPIALFPLLEEVHEEGLPGYSKDQLKCNFVTIL